MAMVIADAGRSRGGLFSKPAYGERTGRGKLGASSATVDPELSPSMQEKVQDYLEEMHFRKKRELQRLQDNTERAQRAEQLRLERDRINKENMVTRCKKELEKNNPEWKPIGLEVVQSNHAKSSKGIFYGMEFPWSEETLEQYGPEWLTQAFHTAGTLAPDNRVTAVILNTKVKITAGNNGGKFLFEVRYARRDPELHTKLFAKVPFPMTPALKTDRLSSSVYKQPMDFAEINTYRLYEASLPFRTPKFYFGDISNETSNFIIILECLEFAGHGKVTKGPQLAKPYQIEGPYDKCKDYQLPGPAKDYYTKIMECLGKCAGAHKAGKFGTDEQIARNLLYVQVKGGSENPTAWGVNPGACTGQDPTTVARAMDAGLKFLSETGKVLYPKYVTSQQFGEKYTRVMMTLNAYTAELQFWKNVSKDYVAVGHQNMNMDNVFYWRDEKGTLDCGGLDWGGFGVMCLAHKVWWALNCADYDNITANFDHFINTCLDCYESLGGPKVDRKVFKDQVIITGLQNFMQMVNAIPNSLKMCPLKEWATIQDRHDPRIAGDIDGKSTLRTTIHVLGTGLRLMQEMDGDKVLDRWIQEYWVGTLKHKPKPDEIIFGKGAPQEVGPAPKEAAKEEEEEEEEPEETAEEIAEATQIKMYRDTLNQEKMQERCKKEMAKESPAWKNVDLSVVSANHAKKSPGMFYGMEFPWSEDTLAEFGPAWLTKAFHAAGTLDPDNSVTAVILDKKTKITAGNNGGKFLFEVMYAREDPALHTKLFAKVPFPMTPQLRTDRLSSSVYKQPMDFSEVNTYRLYESALPFRTPKFYFGDISNETTNFIIILERLDFASMGKKKKKWPIPPYKIEGPYDKCKDYQLPGPAKDYYGKIMENIGLCAGAHKAGKFGTDDDIAKNILMVKLDPDKPQDYGVDPDKCTGQDPAQYEKVAQTGIKFIAETGKVLYPKYVTSGNFKEKFMKVMMTLNAYKAEITFWKNSNQAYSAIGHQNSNMDNNYFWRDDEGKLQCGGLDWGAFGVLCLAHKVWWALNCADYDNVADNFDYFIDTVLAKYAEGGGPKLDKKVFTQQVIITGLENFAQMVAAIPNSMQMCPAKEWPTIKDRHDPRIADDVNGKSTLRTTIHVIGTGLRLMEEMKGDEVLDNWIENYWVGECGLPKKKELVVFGKVTSTHA